MRPELVIFDCDGGLVDSEPLAMRVLLETFSEAGLSLDTVAGYDRFLGSSLTSISATLSKDFRVDLADSALNTMRLRLRPAC